MTDKLLNSTSSSIESQCSLSNSNYPEAKSPYNLLTHSVRKIIPAEIACKIGCNGNKCKYDSSNWPKEKMAIHGLYSNW